MALRFGQAFANQIRRRRPCPGDTCHLDEVVVRIAGVKHWLWCAVDQTGDVQGGAKNQAMGRRTFRPLRRPLAEGVAERTSRDEKPFRPIWSSLDQHARPLIRGGWVA